MSVSTGNNVSAKEYNRISKYKDLEIEIEKMWHLKINTMPVIVGALDMIKKGTDKKLRFLIIPFYMKKKKIVLYKTVYHLRRVISM